MSHSKGYFSRGEQASSRNSLKIGQTRTDICTVVDEKMYQRQDRTNYNNKTGLDRDKIAMTTKETGRLREGRELQNKDKTAIGQDMQLIGKDVQQERKSNDRRTSDGTGRVI